MNYFCEFFGLRNNNGPKRYFIVRTGQEDNLLICHDQNILGKKKYLKKSVLIAIICAEVVAVAVSCYAIYYLSWRNISDRRCAVLSAEMKEFDTSPITAKVRKCYIKAMKSIKEVRDETVWTTDAVYFRTGPGKSHDIVGTFGMYTGLKRTGVTYNHWSRVLYNDTEYFVRSKYLTTDTPLITEGGAKGEYQRFALSQLENYGWSDTEIVPLIQLWNRESGWNPNSHNRSSGAHGIPQALPASKMAAFGSDYYTNGNTQILWGLNYIANRYGSPSAAWAHFCSSGWY